MDINDLTLEMLQDCQPINIWRYRERRIGHQNKTLVRWSPDCEEYDERDLHYRLAPIPWERDNHQVIEVELSPEHGGHHIHLLFSDNNLYASMDSTQDPNEYTWERR